MGSDGTAEVVGVGDVAMVRTFRVGDDGGLYPVNTATAWTDGWNTAVCGRGRAHVPPAPGYRCGFYVYADPACTSSPPPASQVLAVVAVHGVMEAGSRGARVGQARVQAVWLGRRVSPALAGRVAGRYPGVAVFRNGRRCWASSR